MLPMKSAAFLTGKKRNLMICVPLYWLRLLVNLEMTPMNTNNSAVQENRTERSR